ncbi:MAG: preprotein translocase subunit SecG [Pseudomonadales bacterium]|jgi:preprotein translocase subunit SecG|nr:preprotein translocase subunit SecG [Gammaproteobacteria bacterium]MCH1598100.1 preprotein translocase subunit SecG [Pseudomonadales bacterium]MDP6186557.1 preprotein translocase subunit SecG [Pseudomonadales bacterium]RPG28530.1 MAG: preprotein translocase subunit SecG [Gammaproteobacteria bacterium TMED243]
MSTVETVLLSLLVIDALALITLVLIQQGKGADVGAAFGSGSSNTVFGSSGGATAMTRLTTWLAIGFFVIAFGLAYTAKERSEQAGNLGIPQVMNSASENATDLPSSDDLTPAADDQSDEIPEF